ncbi:MAG: serine/threonine-protein kinase [Canibacter sp.]
MTAPTAPQIAGFQYVRPLGKGGFARVYLYEQDMPRRIVAVKVLNKAVGEIQQAFETEADLMARLASHPSIVSIYEASLSADGHPYLVMEFCPDSMGARAKQRPLPLQDVLDAGVRLAGALETAHRVGVLHRDIKPSNVLTTITGKPALTDFGIADLAAKDTTEQTEMALSVPWSAPEVVTKVETGTVPSEIWALAATLYTFASGRSPFASRVKPDAKDVHKALVKEIVKANYQPVEGAVGYEPFDNVLARAMSKRPEDRFASMAEFAQELQNLQRYFGYDITPLEVVEAAWMPQMHEIEPGVRGPVASTVGRTPRAQQRIAPPPQHTDKTGKRTTTQHQRSGGSSLTTGLLAAAGTAIVLGGIYIIGRLGGWL